MLLHCLQPGKECVHLADIHREFRNAVHRDKMHGIGVLVDGIELEGNFRLWFHVGLPHGIELVRCDCRDGGRCKMRCVARDDDVATGRSGSGS